MKNYTLRTTALLSAFSLLSACATPRGTDRKPADSPTAAEVDCTTLANPRERQFCSLVRKDALETLGVLVELELQKIRWQTMVANSEIPNLGPEPSSSIGLRGGLGIHLAPHLTLLILGYSVAPNSLIASAHEDESSARLLRASNLKDKETSWLFGPQFGSAAISVATLYDLAAEYGDFRSKDSANNILFNTSITKKEYREMDKGDTAAQRLRLKTAIRKSADEISESAGGVFALTEAQRLTLALDIEKDFVSKLELASSQTEPGVKTLKSIDKLSIDIAATLLKQKVDVRRKIAAIGRIVDDLKSKPFASCNPDLFARSIETLDGIDAALGAIIQASKQHVKFARDRNDERLDSLMRETLATMQASEVLRTKVKAHLSLVEDAR